VIGINNFFVKVFIERFCITYIFQVKLFMTNCELPSTTVTMIFHISVIPNKLLYVFCSTV